MRGVSVVICCYNSALRLPKTLEYLSKQAVDQQIRWEVVLVDNHSFDATGEVALKNWRSLGEIVPLRVVRESRPGLTYARKRGVYEAKYDFIIFCDDDNWLCPDYVQLAHSVLIKNSKLGIVGGEGIPSSDDPMPEWFDEYQSFFAVGPQKKRGGRFMEIYGAGMVTRKDIMMKCYQKYNSLVSDRKGSKLISGGDNELCYWVLHQGYELSFEKNLKFYHHIPKERLTITYLRRLSFWMGYSGGLLAPYQYFQRGDREVLLRKFIWLKDFLYFSKELLRVKNRIRRQKLIGTIFLIVSLNTRYDQMIKETYVMLNEQV